MNIIEESVKKIEEIIEDTGCSDGVVELRRKPDAVTCQYERGVCIESCYGGRTGEFVTQDPIEATMKISFMFGVPLNTQKTMGAACAILNALTSFLCLTRGIRACPGSEHGACRTLLAKRLAGKQVFFAGEIPLAGSTLPICMVPDPESADVILINNEGLIADSVSAIVNRYRGRKEIICVGPSTAGVAGLHQIERFCPFGV